MVLESDTRGEGQIPHIGLISSFLTCTFLFIAHLLQAGQADSSYWHLFRFGVCKVLG